LKKGFTYIITTMIIIILITGVVIMSNTNQKSKTKTVSYIAKNYETEFIYKISEIPTIQDINQFNYNFIKFINSNNYDAKICNIIKTSESTILSNFTDIDCNLMINGDYNQTISKNTTISIDTFINDTNIYLCNCYNVGEKNIYYIDIYNENSKTIFKN